MQITLKALFDDETRKEIREHLLGQVKALTRELVEKTVTEEAKRVVAAKLASIGEPSSGWFWEGIVTKALKNLLDSRWDGYVLRMIRETAVDEVKIAIGSVTMNDDKVRSIVRQELRQMLSGGKP